MSNHSQSANKSERSRWSVSPFLDTLTSRWQQDCPFTFTTESSMDRPKRLRLLCVHLCKSWLKSRLFGLLSGSILLIFLSGCEQSLAMQSQASSTFSQAEGEVETTDIHSLNRALTMKPLIIDVRTKAEFERYHIVSAQNYPLPTLPSQLSQLPTEQAIYLVCATGRRSKKAAEMLHAYGFQRPINVLTGTEGWKQAGYELEQ